MKLLIAIFFIFIFFSVSPAQPSGYLGKRFTISYEQLTGPNYLYLFENALMAGDLGSNSQISESKAYWNYIGTISLDYVLGKTKSRGLSISPIDQTMFFEDNTVDPLNGNQHTSFMNNAKLTGVTIGLYVKYFKKKNIAPLGDYYKLEFLYSDYQIKSFYKQAELYNLCKSRLEPFSTLGFAITYGKNRIFWDKIVISAGITSGFRMSFFSQIFTHDDGNESSQAFNKLKKSAQYWHGQNLFYNLHLGIGFLLF